MWFGRKSLRRAEERMFRAACAADPDPFVWSRRRQVQLFFDRSHFLILNHFPALTVYRLKLLPFMIKREPEHGVAHKPA